jgi:pyridoxamine 5'-phosphate oxidase
VVTETSQNGERASLTERDVAADPFEQFRRWMDEATIAPHTGEANAMTLATAAADGSPSARVVLLRGFDHRGFVFFTDYRSRKGAELAANPRAALVFYWGALERQVRVTGTVAPVASEESDAYFRSRPAGSRVSASASHQSSVIADRATLERRVAALVATYGDAADIPRPPYWGGYRVSPQVFEFWQGRANRLHDRIRYRHDAGDPAAGWRIERLSP